MMDCEVTEQTKIVPVINLAVIILAATFLLVEIIQLVS